MCNYRTDVIAIFSFTIFSILLCIFCTYQFFSQEISTNQYKRVLELCDDNITVKCFAYDCLNKDGKISNNEFYLISELDKKYKSQVIKNQILDKYKNGGS